MNRKSELRQGIRSKIVQVGPQNYSRAVELIVSLLRRLHRAALPLHRHLAPQHRLQELAGVATLLLDDVFQQAGRDDLAASIWYGRPQNSVLVHLSTPLTSSETSSDEGSRSLLWLQRFRRSPRC